MGAALPSDGECREGAVALRNARVDLQERSLGGILDETFALYGGQAWRYMGLVAVARAPLAIAAFALAALVGRGTTGMVIDIVLWTFGAVAIYAACTCAVGQQYLSGKFDLRACYSRAWWRAISLGGLGLAAALLATAIMWLGRGPSTGAAIALSAVLFVVGIYLWPTAVQSMVVEGRRTVGALRRSFGLVAGSWWRLAAIAMVLGLVILGLAILVTLPFVTLVLVVANGQSSVVMLLFTLSGELMYVVVMPVIFIAGTLTYYDLRVRKEQYDLETLSREMGAVTA